MRPRPGPRSPAGRWYLPRSWTSDPARCRAAGVTDGTAFATKPALARQMITRALDAGTPAAWVTADEVYGQDPALRAELARRGTGYVVAILPHPESSCTGPDGNDDIRPQPAPATTAEQPSTPDDHEMSLED
jgi:SRSO17 transposase